MIEFTKNIVKCSELLLNLNYLFQSNSLNSLNVSDEFKKASLNKLPYKTIYDLAIKNNDFNLMLNDKSFFQFNEKEANKELRLAFYPNPYNLFEYDEFSKEAIDLLHSNEITYDEYDQLTTEFNFYLDVPPIRYDLSYKQYKAPYHPTGHFHIGFCNENRWPVKRLFNPYLFVLKILVHYYYNVFTQSTNNDDTNLLNLIEDEYKKELYNTDFVSSDFFTVDEENRLHFK